MTAAPAAGSTPPVAAGRPRILILGGGYVGLYTALGLKKQLNKGEADITIVDPRPYMTYQPFLPEAAAGSIESRHVVVPLRRNLKGVNVVVGAVTDFSHADRYATISPQQGESFTITYDVVVIALGSIARVLPIPGLAEQAIGFKTVEEAISLRNHVLDRLDAASTLNDPEARRRALTFVFVGGGYAGIEALAELQDLVYDATEQYTNITHADVNFVLVEALGRILPEVGEEMGRWTLQQLRRRGIDCRLETFLKGCENGRVVLSDGAEFDADTIVWTAGVKANPVLGQGDLPLDKMGRLRVRADLRVSGDDGIVEGAWGAGDVAAVPDLTKEPGNFCAPNAQHAVRESKQMAKNIVAVLRGEPTTDYSHKYVGSVASLGVGKGVATVYGLKIKGYPAWLMHRGYHLMAIPTFDRKLRVLLGWIAGAVMKRDMVAISRMERPREEFTMSAAKPPAPRLAKPSEAKDSASQA